MAMVEAMHGTREDPFEQRQDALELVQELLVEEVDQIILLSLALNMIEEGGEPFEKVGIHFWFFHRPLIGSKHVRDKEFELFHAVFVSDTNRGDKGEFHLTDDFIRNLVVALLKNELSGVVRRVNCLLVTLTPGSVLQGLQRGIKGITNAGVARRITHHVRFLVIRKGGTTGSASCFGGVFSSCWGAFASACASEDLCFWPRRIVAVHSIALCGTKWVFDMVFVGVDAYISGCGVEAAIVVSYQRMSQSTEASPYQIFIRCTQICSLLRVQMNTIELSGMGWVVHGVKVCVGAVESGCVGFRIVCFGVSVAAGKRERKATVVAKRAARASITP